jgi:hypothetical protein
VDRGARKRFVPAYDSNIGAIRQMFPRDRAQQDLHFGIVDPKGMRHRRAPGMGLGDKLHAAEIRSYCCP